MNTTDGVTTIINSDLNTIEIYHDPRYANDIIRIEVVVFDKRDNSDKKIYFPYHVWKEMLKADKYAKQSCCRYPMFKMPVSYRIRKSGKGLQIRYDVTALFTKENITVNPEKTLQKIDRKVTNAILELEIE